MREPGLSARFRLPRSWLPACIVGGPHGGSLRLICIFSACSRLHPVRSILGDRWGLFIGLS